MDRRKPKNSTSKIIIEIAVIAVVALLMIVLAVVLFYKPWLDDEVPWTTPPTETTVTPGPGVVTPPPPDFVRNQDVTNFLVLGRDRVANLTDAIMLVQFNTKEHYRYRVTHTRITNRATIRSTDFTRTIWC